MTDAHPDRATTVLVVDDNPQVLDGMRRLLESGGYRVLAAANGRAALSLLRCTELRSLSRGFEHRRLAEARPS